MKRLLGLFLLLAPLAAPMAGPMVHAEEPWVRESAPGTPANAAYMTLRNEGDETATVTAVSAEGFGRAAIHETVETDEGTGMQAVEALDIPAGESVQLAPGGMHLMLREPDARVEDGDWVTLMLRFDGGRMLEITAPVRRRTGREEGSDPS